MIYPMIFSFAAIFFFIAETRYNNYLYISFGDTKNKFRTAHLYALFGILLLSVLAGLRGPDVGTDVKVYVLNIFNDNRLRDSIIAVYEHHFVEFGYESFNYIISRFTNDVHWLHFFVSLIITGGVYRFLLIFDKKVSLTIGMLIFMCAYFSQSLNMVRQSMAMSIYVGWGVGYLIYNKPIKYFLVCVVAMMFHSSAIVAVVIYFLYKFLNVEHGEIKRITVLLTVIFIALLFFEPVCRLLIDAGVLPVKYGNYLVSKDGLTVLGPRLTAKAALMLGGMLLWNKLAIHDRRAKIWWTFLAIDFFVQVLTVQFEYTARLSSYFEIWQIIYLAEIYIVLKNLVVARDKLIITASYVTLAMMYWFYLSIFKRAHEVYPYVSDVITWL